jgi:hypothetical protein
MTVRFRDVLNGLIERRNSSRIIKYFCIYNTGRPFIGNDINIFIPFDLRKLFLNKISIESLFIIYILI